LNLIRVMPAEGWDAMLTSVYLARLIGPVMLAVGIGLVVSPAAYRTLAREFLDSTALVYLSGLLTMTAGLAILLAHRVVAPDWRTLITLLGLLMLVGGAIRIISPGTAVRYGRYLLDRPPSVKVTALQIAAAIWLILGAILTIAGYWPQTPTP
jgi:uncharacterized membrane protein HdeD (DUF308 family)